MHNAPPPLNALRAFEAAARHLSLTKAALELNVTPGALSHQIRGLEDHLGLKLFDRGVRSITLTAAGKALHPGLQAGFLHIRDALASLNTLGDTRIRDQHVARLHLEMAGAAALPLFARPSRNRRARFLVDQ
jgi:LysR family transcriptional regulator, glycine cleavage system transcriptional activator